MRRSPSVEMPSSVLIVDDDPVQRRLLDATLRRLGYETLQADSGEAALAMLRDGEAVDALVLDLSMPGLDGMGVLAALREGGIEVPAIVQTSSGTIETVVAAMRAGIRTRLVSGICVRARCIGLKRLRIPATI